MFKDGLLRLSLKMVGLKEIGSETVGYQREQGINGKNRFFHYKSVVMFYLVQVSKKVND